MPARSPSVRGPLRVLVGLGETAGYCTFLAQGLREAGAVAEHVNLGGDRLSFGQPPRSRLARAVRWLGRRRQDGPGPRPVWMLLQRMGMVALLVDAVVRYDVFILRAGDSFLRLHDLPLLRMLGKTVIVVFFGSDSRPSYLNGHEIAAAQSGAETSRATAAKLRVVRRVERAATHVVCHSMTAQLHRRRAAAFLAMGIPRRTGPEWTPPAPGGPIRFLHAPSRPDAKGTDRIRATMDEVRADGLDVDLRVLEGRPNAEVLSAIREADVVIDQLYSDTPMASLAAEAASIGRPAIVGGYGWDALRLQEQELPPTHLCHPDDLAAAIRRLATDEAYRLDLGARARDYVQHRWAPKQVGERYLALVTGDAPAEWWFDPPEVRYIHGVGASEQAIRASVIEVLEARGPAGLCLDHRPELVEALLVLAGRGARATRP